MSRVAASIAGILCACGVASAAPTTVLFIGNSFTYGHGSAVRFYRASTVTDLNGEGIGGVPALFKSFADEAGLDYDVSLETRGGTGLDFHLANKLDVIGRRGWDVVVMHGYSTLDAEALWSYALKALAGRAHSTGELREKLRRRAERISDIDDVIARLKENGYLDDRRFAEGYAAARLSNDRLGRGRVVQDLRQRRVAPAVAEKTVRQVYEDVDEQALIDEFIRKKYRLAPREAVRRLQAGVGQGGERRGRLLQRGHTPYVVEGDAQQLPRLEPTQDRSGRGEVVPSLAIEP